MSSNKFNKEDLEDLSSGTSTLLRQFRPMAYEKVSAKKLLIDDHDYSTPQDHYFAYVNKRNNGYTLDDDKLAND